MAIPNGVDSSRLKTSDFRHQQEFSDLKSKVSHLRIGCIARLAWEKGVDLLLEAVKDLPEVSLSIVGTGREEQRIRRIIDAINQQLKTQNLKLRINLRPSVTDVSAFYHSIDLFVLPSRDHDPCPLAPIEAMACGIPVIMTDACGTAEHLKNGTDALVVRAHSAQTLKEAIKKMMNANFRTSIAQQGQRTARRNFTLENMVDAYENLLKGT